MEYTPSLASYDENLHRNSSLTLAERISHNSATEVKKNLTGHAQTSYHHKSGSFENLTEPA